MGEGHRRQTKGGPARPVPGPRPTGPILNILFFNSYEEAMQNSSLPETDTFSKKMMGLADGSPTFYNLDVEDDRSH